MTREKPYEVTLLETRILKIRVDAVDPDQAEENASDIYLHQGFQSGCMVEDLENGGGFEVIDVRPIKPNESKTDAVR